MVIFHDGAGIVGGGNVPERGVGEIIFEEGVADAGTHVWGWGIGGKNLKGGRGRRGEPVYGRGGKRGLSRGKSYRRDIRDIQRDAGCEK